MIAKDKELVTAARKYVTVATAGHVDHGKTSLLKALTGIDTDRLKEEKERQMTTDLGFAHLKLRDDLWIGFIDVPGHGKFLKNMLAGVGGIDMALLVVAADEGPMPQTEQHVRILSLLGVNKALVAVTKIDTVDQQQIDETKNRIGELLHRYQVTAKAVVELDCIHGTGFPQLKEELGNIYRESRVLDTGGGALLPIDRVFSKTGFGTVVTGTLVRGSLKTSQEVFIEPLGVKARIRRLESFGQTVETASDGQRLACNVAIRDNVTLVRGMTISSTRMHSADNLLVSLEGQADFKPPQPVRIYHGTAEAHGVCTWLAHHGSSAIANITLDQKLVVEPYDRYVMRLTDDSIYGGAVIMKNRPRWMTKELAAKFSASEDKVSTYLQLSPVHHTTEEQLRTFVPQNESLPTDTKYGDYFADPEFVHSLKGKVASALAAEHEGLTLEALRLKIQRNIQKTFFQTLLDEWVRQGVLLRKADRFQSAQTKAPVPEEDDGSIEKLVNVLANHLCIEIDELAVQVGYPPAKVRKILKNLMDSRQAFIVNYDFASPKEKIEQAHHILSDLWRDRKEIAPGEFRERLGTSRKYAMALLAHFDDQQITRRLPTGRVLLKSAN
jgi:selenocysteine-specific elongation factor